MVIVYYIDVVFFVYDVDFVGWNIKLWEYVMVFGNKVELIIVC